MNTRREFLKLSAMAGASLLVPWKRALAAIAGGTLAPGGVNKFVQPLVKPPAMPGKFLSNMDQYQIAVRQFQQQILPPGLPQTTVWSYGSVDQPGTFNYPAFTIEAAWNKPVQVIWRNELVNANGGYLPHLLPVDPTLHWANPPGGSADRDSRPTFHSTPGPYTGPVPIVTHVHGAHTTEDSDGFPEAWFLPAANNIPGNYAEIGTYFQFFNNKYGKGWSRGAAAFKYPNDQRATTLWYHDHTLGMTRLNVYAGPAGFYLIRGGPDDQVGGVLPGPAPTVGSNPLATFYEIPIAIQDRSFNADGSLFYPDSREFFDGFTGPFIGEGNSDISPIWNPEFFGNMMVVNGFTWPYLEVERRRYRFRFLNGCNSRFLLLKLSKSPRRNNRNFNKPEGTFWQIGAEGGFLPQAVELNQLLMGLAERADVIVDFSQFKAGDEVYLVNDGPDSPFGGISTEDLSDWQSTGLVMKFIVRPGPATDPSTHPANLVLPAITHLGPADNESTPRQVTLNEQVSETLEDENGEAIGPREAVLGMVGPDGNPLPLMWGDELTENPALNATEIWEIGNFTEDAHPIHVHLVQFEVLGREPMNGGTSVAGSNGPLPWETGFKDTVIAYPGEVTRIKAKFDTAGLFVWHCHIVEHEDNEMMRPYQVG